MGEISHTHHLKPSKSTHNEKSKLHFQSLEMPNTISCRVAEYSTCGHLPSDWARLFISSTVFLRESWSDRDTNTGRIYLIRAEEEGKQKQGPAFIFAWKRSPTPSIHPHPSNYSSGKNFLLKEHNCFTILHCKIEYSAELLLLYWNIFISFCEENSFQNFGIFAVFQFLIDQYIWHR